MRQVTAQDLDIIWQALQAYRENNIYSPEPEYDQEWDDICTVMARITEQLEI